MLQKDESKDESINLQAVAIKKTLKQPYIFRKTINLNEILKKNVKKLEDLLITSGF